MRSLRPFAAFALAAAACAAPVATRAQAPSDPTYRRVPIAAFPTAAALTDSLTRTASVTDASARTTALTADRGLRSWRVGTGARISVRAYGDTAGTLAVTGGLNLGTVTVPAGGWVVDIVAQCTGGTAWTITRQVNGGAPTYGTATSSGDIKPVFTPAGGAQLRGIEVRVGG